MNARFCISGLCAMLGALLCACSRDAAEGPGDGGLAFPDVSGTADATDAARPWQDAHVDPAPGAGACGTVGRDLGLGLTPWPAGSVHGRLTRLETLPGALKLTLRTREGVTATYSVTGPFDGVTAELFPEPAEVHIGVEGEAFVLRVGTCGWPPLVAVAGRWSDLESFVGPFRADEFHTCGADAVCPRDYARQMSEGVWLRPGETSQDLQSRYLLGQLHGCAADPGGPSHAEWVSVPRSDVSVCPGAAAARREPAFDLAFTFIGSADPPELEQELAYEGEVDVEQTEAGLTLVPRQDAAPFAEARLGWHSGLTLPVLRAPVHAALFRLDTEWSRAALVELRDADGLALLGIDAAPGRYPQWAGRAGWDFDAPTCVAAPDPQFGLATLGHPVTLTDGAARVTWQPGDESVVLAGHPYDLDLRAAHTWAEGCVTDIPSGWASFALRRRE